MDIKEICNSKTVNTDEMIFVVKSYIKEKKGFDVEIDLLSSNSIFMSFPSHNISKLAKAFEYASYYFLNK